MNSPQAYLQQLLSMGNNPQQIMQAIIQNNPQMKIVLNQIQQSGLTMDQFIMQMARQRGIPMDANSLGQIMNQLRGQIPR